MEASLMSSQWVAPVVIFVLVAVLVIIMATVVRNYHTVPPNRVDVVSGRRHKHGDVVRGYRIVMGGGYFRIPILESVQRMELTLMTIPVEVKSAPDKNGALVTVRGVAQVKVKSDPTALALAIERFLGFNSDQVKNVARETLEGNLRAIVGMMTIESLIGDRASLQEKNLSEAGADLAKMGLVIDLLTLQEIEDDRGYIQSLGKKRTAEVVRDATIGEAQAQRDSDVAAADARKLGEVAKADAEKQISEALRDRDVVTAQNQARVEGEKARVAMRAKQATAEEQKALNVAEVAAIQARVEAEAELQTAEKRRNEARHEATTVTDARKQGEAAVVKAEAERKAAELDGEAARIKAEKEGQGEQARQTAESIGRKAIAEAVRAELEAKAAGDRAQLEAQADGRKALLIAEAAGAKAKAEAFAALDPTGRLLLILEALPKVIESVGQAGNGLVAPMADAIGEGLGNIGEIRMVDLGGSGNGNGHGNGQSMINRFANMPVETVFGLIEKVNAIGLSPAVKSLVKRFGFDLDQLMENSRALKEDPTPAIDARETPEDSAPELAPEASPVN